MLRVLAHRAPLFLASGALLLVPAACSGGTEPGEAEGDAIPRWPADPVGLRLREKERGGLELAEMRPRLIGDGVRVEVLTQDLAEVDRELWSEELVALALQTGPLQLLRHLFEGEPHGAFDADRVFAPEARLAALTIELSAGAETGAETLGPGLTRERALAPTEPAPPVDAAAWVAAARELVGEHARMRWARFLPGETVLEEGRALVEVEYEINGVLPEGGLRHERGRLATVWVPHTVERGAEPPDVPWRCVELARAPLHREGEGEGAVRERLQSDGPWFVDATLEAFAGTRDDPRLPQFPPNVHLGLALADVDGDDDLDLFAAQPTRLYLNRGNGTFDSAEGSGIRRDPAPVGVLAADFDLDGDVDAFWGGRQKQHSYLSVQDEPLRFRNHVVEASFKNSLSTSLSAYDIDGDGYLDVFIAGYGSFGSPGPDDPINADNGRMNQVLRGGPDLAFTDVTEEWGLSGERLRWCFIGAFGDADGDGDVDLYAANDWGPNVLYRRLEGAGVRFRAEVEDPEIARPGFSMSAYWGDLDGDLDLDMYVSNMSSPEANRLQWMDPEGAQGEKITHMRRVLSEGNTVLRNGGEALAQVETRRGGRDALWAWGTALFDLELDGDLDVHVVNGFLSHGVDDGRDFDSAWWRHGLPALERDPHDWPAFYDQFNRNADLGWSWAGFQRAVFFRNAGQADFVDIAPIVGLDQKNDGRGVALGDLDGDGDPDLVATSNSHPSLYVLRNVGPRDGGFLWVDLVPAGNRSPAGAVVVVRAGERAWRRDVAIGAGYLAQHELAQHFGLDGARTVDSIEITWPDGERTFLGAFDANQRLRVRQGVDPVERMPLAEPVGERRVAPIEWDSFEGHLRSFTGRAPDFASFDFVDFAGQRVSLRGGTSVLVLFDPSDPDVGPTLAAAAELAHAEEGTKAPRVVAVALNGSEAGAQPVSARLAERKATELAERGVRTVRLGEGQQRELAELLRPWSGATGLRTPSAIVLTPKGAGRAMSVGVVVADHLRLYLQR